MISLRPIQHNVARLGYSRKPISAIAPRAHRNNIAKAIGIGSAVAFAAWAACAALATIPVRGLRLKQLSYPNIVENPPKRQTLMTHPRWYGGGKTFMFTRPGDQGPYKKALIYNHGFCDNAKRYRFNRLPDKGEMIITLFQDAKKRDMTQLLDRLQEEGIEEFIITGNSGGCVRSRELLDCYLEEKNQKKDLPSLKKMVLTSPVVKLPKHWPVRRAVVPKRVVKHFTLDKYLNQDTTKYKDIDINIQFSPKDMYIDDLTKHQDALQTVFGENAEVVQNTQYDQYRNPHCNVLRYILEGQHESE